MSVDARYFYRELKEILGKLEYSTADEIARHLRMLADMAQPLDIEIPKRAEGETQGPSIHYAPAGYRYLAPEEVLAEGDMIDADDGEIRKASAIGLKVRQAACVRYIRAIQAPGEPKTGDPARDAYEIVKSWQGPLWDAVNAYMLACGGSGSKGGEPRIKAVSALNRTVETLVASVWPAEGDRGHREATGAREVDPEAAWKALREVLGTDGWTTSDAATYRGFFMWGWGAHIKSSQRAPEGTQEEVGKP